MTTFTACLFGLAALASVLTIFATVRRHGVQAMAIKAQLAACPGSMVVTWKSVERVSLPALAVLRKHPARRTAARLEWPGATLDLAA